MRRGKSTDKQNTPHAKSKSKLIRQKTDKGLVKHNNSSTKKSHSNIGWDTSLKKTSVVKGDITGLDTPLAKHKVKVIARFRPLNKMELVI